MSFFGSTDKNKGASNDKLNSLLKYAEDTKNRLESEAIPAKHASHPEAYKAYLRRELEVVTRKIDGIRMNGTTDKK